MKNYLVLVGLISLTACTTGTPISGLFAGPPTTQVSTVPVATTTSITTTIY